MARRLELVVPSNLNEVFILWNKKLFGALVLKSTCKEIHGFAWKYGAWPELFEVKFSC